MPEPGTVYFALPYALKSMGASIRGWHLDRQRFGPETERLVAEAHAREQWTSGEMTGWQAERVKDLLTFAAGAVPGYRHLFERLGAGDRDIRRLDSWPIVRKEALRHDADDFLAEGFNTSNCTAVATSGSTGTPLRLLVDRPGLHHWYALFEARWRRWHGVRRGDRWAVLGGQMVAAPGRSRPPFWVWNAGMSQLYLSAYHISPAAAVAYIEAIRRHRVKYLLGYPSAMAELARCAVQEGLEGPPLTVVISNAEPLLPDQRQILEGFFSCPVRDTYGMAEMVAAAGECERGELHLWPDAGVIEVLDDDDRPLPPGEVGRLICTGLLNRAMPLIRYEVGDRGSLAPPGEACECGRLLPILRSIEGRLDDLVLTPDGRRIGRLDTVFKADLPIRAAQIVQVSWNQLTVNVVPEEGFSEAVEAIVRHRISDRVGPMEVLFQTFESIPRGPGGKRRGVISQIRSEQC